MNQYLLLLSSPFFLNTHQNQQINQQINRKQRQCFFSQTVSFLREDKIMSPERCLLKKMASIGSEIEDPEFVWELFERQDITCHDNFSLIDSIKEDISRKSLDGAVYLVLTMDVFTLLPFHRTNQYSWRRSGTERFLNTNEKQEYVWGDVHSQLSKRYYILNEKSADGFKPTVLRCTVYCRESNYLLYFRRDTSRICSRQQMNQLLE